VLLCHCKGVSDRVIDTAIACGASTLDDVARACGAGAYCGGCRPGIEDLLEGRRDDVLVAITRSA
jgi:bacterioferritin-associated ferredoxin